MIQPLTLPSTSSVEQPSFWEEFQPNRLLSSLMAGLVTGVIGVIRAISYAALIFSGHLAIHLNVGVGIAVYSTAAISIVVALMSSLPGMIATPLAAPTAVLAVLAAAIAERMSNAPDEQCLLTVTAAIAIGSLCTGLFLVLLGIFKLGKTISSIPYPVVGGFMAGTGWLLVAGGIQVMTDRALSLSQLPFLIQLPLFLHWLPGLILALLLLLVSKRYQHYLIMPGSLLCAIGSFYAILFFSHTPITTARTNGWLLGPFPQGGLWHPLKMAEFTQIDWGIILEQSGTIATLMFISLLSLVLTNNGIELAVERDINLSRELKAVGIANLAAGMGSGMAGNQALPSTLLVHKMGANNRLAGVFKLIPCTAVLILGSSFLSFFPKPILGGLLLYLGIDLLWQWVYKAAFKLPVLDYLTVLSIAIAINIFGFLQGVVFGLTLSVFLFTLKYSRVDATKNESSGAIQRSNIERSHEQVEILNQKGEQIYILQLHGFIFFGTANQLLDQVRDRVEQIPQKPLNYILLDFHLVSGLDSSAVLSFYKIKKLAQQQNLILVYAGLESTVETLLQQGEALEESPQIQTFPKFDRGLAWCEEQILQLECREELSCDAFKLGMRLQR
ncbi:SulP family inorganic anion transporter [Lusitaniella coriacea]|uniref:SulP family inorganic anion transporter n=1 Tax=Lusitaniella coriacea TaxID=1983105 RepID=UPI003CF97398